MSRITRRERDERLRSLERVLDKVDRSVERIELVTVVREPKSGLAVDAYDGLRKQVIAASGERAAHLHQLAQFDAGLRAATSAEELAALVREWMAQACLAVVTDPAVEGAFEVVGDGHGDEYRVLRPAYVDTVSGRVVRGGVVERVEAAEGPGHDSRAGDVSATEEIRP